MLKAEEVFYQNNGDVTKAYYAELNEMGLMGRIAVALFRAQKRSTAAKKYKSRKYTNAAYDVKNWSLQQLSEILNDNAHRVAIKWGWKEDRATKGYSWVLYCDLPTGQVSFHSPYRLVGPDYSGKWDGMRMTRERVLKFCDRVADNWNGKTEE